MIVGDATGLLSDCFFKQKTKTIVFDCNKKTRPIIDYESCYYIDSSPDSYIEQKGKTCYDNDICTVPVMVCYCILQPTTARIWHVGGEASAYSVPQCLKWRNLFYYTDRSISFQDSFLEMLYLVVNIVFFLYCIRNLNRANKGSSETSSVYTPREHMDKKRYKCVVII